MNNKRIAVLLATVMAVSMVAMGFVGTAAAEEPEIEEATINANPAVEDNNDNELVAVVELDLDGEEDITFDDSNDEITIDFDHDSDDGVDFEDVGAGDLAVDFVNDDGEVETVDSSGDFQSVTSNDEGLLTFEADSAGIDVDEIGSSEEPAEYVRIAVTEDNVDFADGIDETDKEATISLDFESGTELDVDQEGVALPLDDDAPIEVDDGAGEDRYSSFASAIADGVNDDTTVTVHEDVDEFEALTESVGDAATVDIGADEVTIEGEDGQETVEFVNVDSDIDEAVAFEDQEQITIGGLDGNGLDFQSSDVVNAHIDSAIDITVSTSGNLQDVNVENNTFTDFQGDTDAVIGIEEADQFVISGNEFHGTDYSGILVENTEFDGGDGSLEVDENVFNDVGDGTAIDVTDSDDNEETTINENSISGLDEGDGVGISVEADGDADTITIDNASIEDNSDGDVGIEIAESSDPSATVNIEGSEAVIEEVDTGIDASDADRDDGTYSIEEVAFDSIESTAVDLTGDYDDDDITLSGVSVANSEDATGVEFSDGGTSLTLVDTQLGTGEDSAVEDGVDATGDIDALTVTDEDNEIRLADDGGAAIDVDDSSSGAITIQDLTVTGVGEDPASNGILIQDAGDNVNIDEGASEGDASSISGVEDGVVIEGADELDNIAWTEFEEIDSVALQIDIDDNIDSTELEIDNVNVSESDEATGIDITYDGDGDDIEIDDSEIIEVANGIVVDTVESDNPDVDVTQSVIAVEDADSEALVVDANSDSDIEDITVEANEFTTEDSEASAILIDEEGSATNSIKFNDIVGFTDGYGLAGDDADDLDREEAIGNWWGHDFGPQHEDASNVFVDVDADADKAAIYDPFLTTDIEDSELDLESPNTDQVTSFAHDIHIEDETASLAFPSTSAYTLADGEAFELIDGSADIVSYDAAAEEDPWVGAEGERPFGLTGYAVVADDAELLFKIEYDSSGNVGPGDYQYEESHNLVSSAAFDEDADVDNSDTFSLSEDDESELANSFSEPGLQIHSGDASNVFTDGNDFEADVSPFDPAWVFVESGSDNVGDLSNPAFSPTANMDEVVDGLDESD